ncbi:hypothetical protein IFT75_12035 [Pseudomonas sp. CFBP 8758]|uniref:RHS repeat-associated core domain-containing protein n=1 Tax=Pseudomonas sp. CFBP 8758 TaxID=2775286 RepID=UPI00177DCEDF|nr:RHS repeat-associated core domain-containing protein [Pseudomonas sp. CFBP 8758]MBD8594134.1 hypothetical protein [Pseudomonas sp. CFBP 8758]
MTNLNSLTAQPLTLSNTVYSQASNFTSAVNTGVDARTGYYTLNIALPSMQANRLSGPVVCPQLHFTPTAGAMDHTLGAGWHWVTSALDLATGDLVLSTGESFKVDWQASDQTPGGLLAFHDVKLKTFHVRRMSTTDGEESFRVEYKTGDSEWLQQRSGTSIAIRTQQRSHLGYTATYHWELIDDHLLLTHITDELATVLLSIDRQPDKVHFTQFPGTPEAAVYSIEILEQQLRLFTLPDASQWQFDYATSDGQLVPIKVIGPLGSEDLVTYDEGDAGHHLPPGAPLTRMPRVASVEHKPGQEQPSVLRTWEWLSDNNHMGGNTLPSDGWNNDRDNLYWLPAGYIYSCAETLWNLNDQPVEVRTFTWNRFHLLTNDVVQRGNNTVTRITTYHHTDQEWESQPAFCQLPWKEETTFKGPGGERTETTLTTYDECGNLLTRQAPDGSIETNTYYAADESGFVRRPHTSTLTPASPALGALPTRKTTVYESLPPRHRDPDDIPHPMLIGERTAHLIDGNEAVFTELTRVWETDVNHPFFGRPTSETVVRNGVARTTAWLRSIEQGNIKVTETIHGDGAVSIDSTTLQHGLTGSTLIETASTGMQTHFAYDVLGRLSVRTDAANSPYAVTTSYRYCVHQEGETDVYKEEITMDGVATRTLFDGDGRTIKVLRKNTDTTASEFKVVWTGAYNVEGSLQSELTQDWLRDMAFPIRQQVNRFLGDWGEVASEYNPDTTITRTEHDPINRRVKKWRETADGAPAGSVITTQHRSGAVELAQFFATDGNLLRTESWQIDGFGRAVSHSTDADGVRTTSTTQYDALDRVTEFQRADGNRVTWAYDGFSEEKPSKVTLTAIDGSQTVLGTRTFDALGRATQVNCMGLSRHQAFIAGQWEPTSSTDALGQTTTYTYEAELGNQLLSVSRNGAAVNRFTYATPNGRLSDVFGGIGEMHQGYTPDGRPQYSDWKVDGQTLRVQGTQSLGGRRSTVTLPDGTLQNLSYNSEGKLQSLISGTGAAHVEVHLTYDSHGRVARTQTFASGTLSLDQLNTYDDFDRELTRTWHSSSAGITTEKVQTLTWTGRGQLASRSFVENNRLLSQERYEYDTMGRLVLMEAEGPEAPSDLRTGRQIARCEFVLTPLDSYSTVTTTFTGGEVNVMSFTYDSCAHDRPVMIIHRGVDDCDIALEWDAAGRLREQRRNGEVMRALQWNDESKLEKVTTAAGSISYGYDPMGRLASQTVGASRQLSIYNGSALIGQILANGQQVTLVGSQRAPYAQSHLASEVRKVMLLGADAQGSVRMELDHVARSISYTPHGADASGAEGLLGYAGEQRDRFTGLYHLGSYRPYCPELMLFLAPDDSSPFGAGGLNRYAYCGGDPVNNIDPSGQSFWKWFVVGVAVVFAVAATVITAGALAGAMGVAISAVGASTAATTGALTISAATIAGAVGAVALSAVGIAALTGAVLEVATIGTGIAEPILEAQGNEKAAGILGWVTLGLSIGSAVSSGVGLSNVATKVASKANRIGAFVGNWQYRLQHAGGQSPASRIWAEVTRSAQEFATTTRQALTYSPTPVPLSPARAVLDAALTEIPNNTQPFNQALRGVNSRLGSWGNQALSTQHAENYADIARQVASGEISNVTGHLNSSRLWFERGGVDGAVGMTFNYVGAILNAGADASSYSTGRFLRGGRP